MPGGHHIPNGNNMVSLRLFCFQNDILCQKWLESDFKNNLAYFFIFMDGVQWNFRNNSVDFTISAGHKKLKTEGDFIENKGIQHRRRPSASSSVEIFGVN